MVRTEQMDGGRSGVSSDAIPESDAASGLRATVHRSIYASSYFSGDSVPSLRLVADLLAEYDCMLEALRGALVKMDCGPNASAVIGAAIAKATGKQP